MSLVGLTACGDDGGEATGTDPGSTTDAPATTGTPPTTGDPTTGDPGTTTDDVDVASSTGEEPPAGSSSGAADGSSSGDAGDSSGGGDSTGAQDGYTVSGAVVSTVDAEDLVGTLYIGLLGSCAIDGERLGSATVENADLGPGNSVTFSVPGLPAGVYYVSGFLDADENADPEDPNPSSGDPVASENFGPACVEVTVVDADEVAPEALVLNLGYPL